MAEQQVLDERQSVTDELDAPRKKREARQAAQAAAQAAMPPEEETVTPEQIREHGYMPQAEPGPRQVGGGGRVAPGRQFDKMSDAVDYMTRPPVTDANRAQAAPDATNMPSPRDIDMQNRGFFPVFAPDGSVAYSVGTGSNAVYEQDLGRRGIPGGLGRLGPRADLQETDPSKPGFTLEPVRGPTGTNYIYTPNQAARDQQAAYMSRQQVARIARTTGIDEYDLAKMTPEQRTNALSRSRSQDQDARAATWKAQAMLAGGRPTGGIGGSKATVNAWLNLPEDQRDSAMRYMLPGGQLSATVDANNAAQGGKMAQAAMTAFLQNNPGATPEQRAAAEIKLRQADPAAAGSADIAAGKHATPEATDEYERVAEKHGTTWAGFSYDDERRLAATLQKPPYKLSQADAEAKAYEYAERRRWVSGGVPGGRAAAPPAGSPPGTPTAPPPGSDPRAWGGGA
jgi:hypothetical protein